MIDKKDMEYVCETPTGYGLFRQKNKAGGYCYYTDEVGCMIWDTAIMHVHDILCAFVAESRRELEEKHSG